MQHFRRVCTMVLIITALMVSRADAIPVPLPSLDKLTEGSTLIVMGQLSSVQHVGSTSIDTSYLKERFGVVLKSPRVNARVERGLIQVEQVLKGVPPPPSFTFDFLVPEEFIGWDTPEERVFGVFFFRTTETGTLEFTDPYFTWIQTGRGLNSSGDSPLDRLISILTAHLSIPDASLETKNKAVVLLQFSKSNASLVALREALSNPIPELSARAAGALMWRGDISGMGIFKRVFLQGQPLPKGLEETLPNTLADIGDPKIIPDLEELLVSSSVYMRRGATFALMRMKSPEAVNGLRNALGDSDFQVRYDAVVGLAEIMGETAWRPSVRAFRSDEIKYLSHWRERAQSR